jgi:fructose-1,6-bisphosphatase/inositol monophosphatase family enzyme
MNKNHQEEYLQFAKNLAYQAGEIMLTYFRAESLVMEWKQDNTPVTIADKQINALVINSVKSTYPNHGVVGEEESYESERSIVWVVDPIDGTAMFNLGMPNSCFCLALVVEGQVQVSVVYDPYSKRLFHASLGMGAYKNDTKFMTPEISDLKNKYCFIPTGSRDKPMFFEKVIIDFKLQGAKIFFIPSYTYLATLVLEGSAVAIVMAYGSPWDCAAVSLIASEAGCVVSNLSDTPRKYNEWSDGIVISNPRQAEFMKESIKNANIRN